MGRVTDTRCMTTTQNLNDRKAATFAKATDTVLINSLTILAAMGSKSAEERQAHAWIIDELERRHPAAAKVVEAAFDAAADEEEKTGEYVHVDYAAVLTAAIAATR
jgi:hypothetical protein